MLIDDIDNYIKYLQNEAGLFVSLQPTHHDMIVNNNLMHYNIHSNPYCIYIKSEQIRWDECIKRHYDIITGDEKDMYFYMCHAGVWEYVYPVFHNGIKMTVIYISGYCADEQERDAALSSYCRNTDVNYEALREIHKKYVTKIIPTRQELDILINPLIHMFKLAYMTCPDTLPHDNLYSDVLYYLNRYHNEHITVEKLSRHFHYSRSAISHIFKKNSGKSINEYICDLRIIEGKNLLENTDLSVTSIAYALGFSDSNYFSAAFKKKCGISPLKYRKKNRQ